MNVSLLAIVTFLSASPSADIFVDSASIRGLMKNKLSSRTTTTTTIDDVVHVDLDSHAIALAETTDVVNPHVATSNPDEQHDRNLSSCTSGTATKWYTPSALPSCCTETAWHPTYSLGWTNGYCRETTDCNSPSYSSELACCKGAYPGQISEVCLNSLPNPPTGSPTYLGEGVYYPDYETDWVDATCKNDRPWSFGPNGRPTYTDMKDCCQSAYAGQVSGKFVCLIHILCYVKWTFISHHILSSILIPNIHIRCMHECLLCKLPKPTHWIPHRLGRGYLLSSLREHVGSWSLYECQAIYIHYR